MAANLGNGLRHERKCRRVWLKRGIDKMSEAAGELRTLRNETETEGRGADDLSELARLVDSLLSYRVRCFFERNAGTAQPVGRLRSGVAQTQIIF